MEEEGKIWRRTGEAGRGGEEMEVLRRRRRKRRKRRRQVEGTCRRRCSRKRGRMTSRHIGLTMDILYVGIYHRVSIVKLRGRVVLCAPVYF